MAEIRDTQGLKADLKNYQSRPAVYRSPAQSNPINDGGSEQKMWNSVSRSLETIFKTKNEMDLAAQDLEKDKISTEIADHYRNLTTQVDENIKSMADGDLAGSKFSQDFADPDNGLYEKYKLPTGKYSDNAIKQMQAHADNASSIFEHNTRTKFHAELVRRTEAMLTNKENRSLADLDNKLVVAHESFPEEFAGKFLEANKNDYANDLITNFRGVLKDKVTGGMLSQEEADRRLYSYGQKMGTVLFNHYTKIDPERALDIALKKGFAVGGKNGECAGQCITLDSSVMATFLTNRIGKRNSHLEKQKRADHVAMMYEVADLNPENYLVHRAIKTKKTITTASGQEKEVDWYELKEPMQWEYDRAFRNGFTTKEGYRAVLRTALLRAQGKHDQALKAEEVEQRRLDNENFTHMTVAIKEFTKSKELDVRDAYLSERYTREEQGWVVKDSFVKEQAQRYGLDPKKVKTQLQDLVIGIKMRVPGAGMDAKPFNTLLGHLESYWGEQITTSPSEQSIKNPMQDTNTHDLTLLSDDQRDIINARVAGYNAIKQFNNNIRNKGYDVLLAESKALESEYQDKESNTKSRAFLKLWPTYKSTRLNHRIKNLMVFPNATAMDDLGIKIDPKGHITDDQKRDIDKWWVDRYGEGRGNRKYMFVPPGVKKFVYTSEHAMQSFLGAVQHTQRGKQFSEEDYQRAISE